MNRQRTESYFSNSDHSYEQSYSWLLTFIECLLHAGLSAVLFMCLTSHNIPVRELFWIAPVPRCGKWVLGSVTWLGPGKSKGRTGIWNQVWLYELEEFSKMTAKIKCVLLNGLHIGLPRSNWAVIVRFGGLGILSRHLSVAKGRCKSLCVHGSVCGCQMVGKDPVDNSRP